MNHAIRLFREMYVLLENNIIIVYEDFYEITEETNIK